MPNKPIVCSFKSPQSLSAGDSLFNSGCSIIDVSFPNMGAVNVGSIAFRNDYTASLTLLCKVKLSAREGESKVCWKTALKKKKLMPNPHTENGGQTRFVLDSSMLRCSLTSVAVVRFVMMQPSPCWISFGLQEIKLYPPDVVEELSVTVPRWLLPTDSLRMAMEDEDPAAGDQMRSLGLPDPEELSNRLHDLWTMTKKSVENQSYSTVGRFDVDGCYEVNLLSYSPTN